MRIMAAPRKYPDELRERATRLAVQARKDPVGRAGAIKRIADQLDVHPEALRGGSSGPRPTKASCPGPPAPRQPGTRSWNER